MKWPRISLSNQAKRLVLTIAASYAFVIAHLLIVTLFMILIGISAIMAVLRIPPEAIPAYPLPPLGPNLFNIIFDWYRTAYLGLGEWLVGGIHSSSQTLYRVGLNTIDFLRKNPHLVVIGASTAFLALELSRAKTSLRKGLQVYDWSTNEAMARISRTRKDGVHIERDDGEEATILADHLKMISGRIYMCPKAIDPGEILRLERELARLKEEIFSQNMIESMPDKHQTRELGARYGILLSKLRMMEEESSKENQNRNGKTFELRDYRIEL